MKLPILIVLTGALLALSACMVVPYDEQRGYYSYGNGHNDYGRPVWNEQSRHSWQRVPGERGW